MKKQKKIRRIGPYTITRTLGRGGMGTVYRAIIPTTGKTAALKLLNPAEPLVDILGMDSLREIFYAEAKAMTHLHHPNIVKALDIGSEGNLPYFTMNYFCNNLGMMIDERDTHDKPTRIIRADKAIACTGQVLEGLEYIHAEGVIHRDIKPHNLLVTDHDIVKICDLGMSKSQLVRSFSSDGMHIGSPYYSAPEQLQDPDQADERSDLYSAGVLLYSMLTGGLPGSKIIPLSRITPLCHDAWDDFFVKSLNVNPDQRYQSAGEMIVALMKLELHWQEQEKQIDRIKRDETAICMTASNLRSSPVRASGSNARKIFMVNDIWQPDSYVVNRFTEEKKETILDKTTGLYWQLTGSDYPVDRDEAEVIVEALNEIQYGGFSTWRLPSVNELLTVAKDPLLPHDNSSIQPFPNSQDWSWSCDRRTEKTSWYVNTSLGYAGWQEDGCRYYVRAVSSSLNTPNTA